METLEIIKNTQSNIYAKYGLEVKNFAPENESSEYYAHTFTIQDKNGLFRIAKKTPAKLGWFVTIWKRGVDGIIAPYDKSDAIDFVVIAVSDGNNIGEFIFPKKILLKKNIFSANGKEGKRAMRVYTPWDNPTSAQAVKTGRWQGQFVVDLKSTSSESSLKINDLYNS